MMTAAAPPSPPGIFLLGMHRSGTSLLTRLLEAAGFHLGTPDELLPAQADNEEGFFERLDVMHLNEWLFEVTDLSPFPRTLHNGWLQGRTITPDQLTAPQWVTFAARAGEILARLKRSGRPWVIKDPRICLTFPCWKALLGPLPVILLNRNPVETAASLEKRDQIPMPVALALWERYLRSALTHSRDCPRTLVILRDLHQKPQSVMRDLQRFLAQHGLPMATPADQIPCADHVNPALIHHKKSSADTETRCTQDQRALLLALQSVPPTDPPAPETDVCDRTMADFLSAREQNAALVETNDRLREALREVEETLTFQVSLLLDLPQPPAEPLPAPTPKPGLRDLFREPAPPPPTPPEVLDFRARMAVCHQNKQLFPSPPLRILLHVHVDDLQFLDASLAAHTTSGCDTLLLTCTSPETLQHLQTRLPAASPHPDGTRTSCLQIATPMSPEDRRLPHEALPAFQQLQPHWILSLFANEFPTPPRRFASIPEWLTEMSRLGMPRACFHEYEFLPCRESPAHNPDTFQETLRWFSPVGPTPISGFAWRCLPDNPAPLERSLPRELQRYSDLMRAGTLRRYLRLQADPDTLPPCTALEFDGGRPEHLNPFAERKIPLFRK